MTASWVVQERVAAHVLVLGLAISAEAQAQGAGSRTGVYIAADLGVAKVSDTDLDYRDEGGTFGGTGAQDTLATEVDLGSAANFGASIGYDFGTIRSDIEIDYSRSSIKSLDIRSLNGSAVTLTAGTSRTSATMPRSKGAAEQAIVSSLMAGGLVSSVPLPTSGSIYRWATLSHLTWAAALA